ncbi:MAG: hypothetical protein JW929_04925 [Anaerolineales bacterium]|nr:hypothetical protein [Anaerolineales bacterium]
MDAYALIAFFVALIFAGLILVFNLLARGRWPHFRPLPGYEEIPADVGASVEAGTRVHMALGEGQIIGVGAEAELAGLSALAKIAQAASVSDRPPVATTSDGVTALLSQDVMYSTYRQMRVEERFDHDLGRLTGMGPAGYTAGAMITPREERVSATILLGAMGAEAALIADTGAQRGSVIAAVTDPVGQAAVFATTDNPLLGEELFAAGAYLRVSPMHAASLKAQDVLRWFAVGAILIGALGSTFLGFFL